MIPEPALRVLEAVADVLARSTAWRVRSNRRGRETPPAVKCGAALGSIAVAGQDGMPEPGRFAHAGRCVEEFHHNDAAGRVEVQHHARRHLLAVRNRLIGEPEAERVRPRVVGECRARAIVLPPGAKEGSWLS